jgi:GDP-mannose transporter
MADKKNEDFVVRMPDNGPRSPYGAEKDPFIPSRPSRVPSHHGVVSPLNKIENSPPLSILAYCIASISMTVVNKYVVSGTSWNLNLFYLAVQVSNILWTFAVFFYL